MERFCTGKSARHVLLVASCALAVGCGPRDALPENDTANVGKSAVIELPPAMLTTSEIASIQAITKASESQAEIQMAKELATRALQGVLFDPGSVQFLNLRIGSGKAVCGKYNAKNRYGAYVGFHDFVVTKDGYLETSENNNGVDSFPDNSFARAYLQYCANPDEKSRYAAMTAPLPDSEDGPVSDEPQVDGQAPDEILDAPPRTEREVPDVTT